MGCSCGEKSVPVKDDNDDNKRQSGLVIDNNKRYEIIIIGNVRYKKIKELGEGATCIVTKLEKDGHYYAHKKIFKKKADISLYKEEISILKMFDHKNIVKFFDVEDKEDSLNIIMEFGGDSNLKKFIKKQGNKLIKEDIISKIVIQICYGLKEIHSKEIIHRDLTPENIFIDETNYEIKIGDFGISTKQKYPKEKIGKEDYLPPEMKNGIEYNYKIDIYALGCIIYELFTLNEYYIKKTIEDNYNTIDFDVYNEKWQCLTDSLLENDFNKRPDISKVIGLIDRDLHKIKKSKNEIILDIIISEQDIGKKIYYFSDKYKDKKINDVNKIIDEIIDEIYIDNVKEKNSNNFFKPEKTGKYNIKIIFKDFMEDCSFMFKDRTHIESIDLSNFATENVTNMKSMFYNCKNLKSINLFLFDTKNVTNMEDMFNNCENLMKIDLSFFDTKNVMNMANMFSGCSNLKEIIFFDFFTENVTNMKSMFQNCINLEKIDLDSFNTEKVENMSFMFSHCQKLKKINRFNTLKTEKVINMKNMFENCKELEKIALSSSKEEKVIDMKEIFLNCFNLKSVDLSSFSINENNKMDEMFKGCDNEILKSIEVKDENSFNILLKLFPKLENKFRLASGKLHV